MTFDFIFWDNDGVLVDTEGLYFQASREALARIGYTLTPDQFAAISLASGRSVFELATEDAVLMDELREVRNRRYAELLAGTNLLLPGVHETVSRLGAQRGMAIVTSSRRDHFDLIHATTGLLPFFDFILCREDYREAKPHPEAYLLALQRSGRRPADCLVIEDSPRGLAAAKTAGLTCWVIPSAQAAGQDFSAADRILGDITELSALLA
ncbi:MAG: HAD family phosphatase [Deltaproteobacteria bacterium]|nr:MAG: HAD family phosphatase [Deltaproteobacteria bacterium]